MKVCTSQFQECFQSAVYEWFTYLIFDRVAKHAAPWSCIESPNPFSMAPPIQVSECFNFAWSADSYRFRIFHHKSFQKRAIV